MLTAVSANVLPVCIGFKQTNNLQLQMADIVSVITAILILEITSEQAPGLNIISVLLAVLADRPVIYTELKVK